MFHALPPQRLRHQHYHPRQHQGLRPEFKPCAPLLGHLASRSIVVLFLTCCLTSSHAQAPPVADPPIPIPIAQDGASTTYMDAIEAHMDYVTEHSYDQIGPRSTPMWLSTIDLRSNGLPTPLMPRSPRWNGICISAPGANLYWDQPTILAAYELSKRTGCKCYSDAASAYISSFFAACTTSKTASCMDPRFYYDVKLERPIDNTGKLYICIPFTPAWETSWTVDKKLARHQVEAFIHSRLADASSNRAVHNSQSDATDAPDVDIESEAALIASLCWLAHQDTHQSKTLIKQALSLAKRRLGYRDHKTGLVPTKRSLHTGGKDISSIGIGAWANVLFRAAEVTGEMEFQTIAKQTLRAWLTVGYDTQQQVYYHQLECESGRPVEKVIQENHSKNPSTSRHQRTNIFDHVHRPAYQSPLRMAEACLSLHEATGDPFSKQAAERWINMIKQQLTTDDSRVSYADDYGRIIHFLVRAAEVLKTPEHRLLARDIAKKAMEKLYVPKMGMFRSHLEENRCDSADGPGLLLLALMYLEGSDPTLESSLQF